MHRIEVSRAEKRETTTSRAHQITWAWTYATLPYDEGYDAHIEAVTHEDIAGFLDRWVLARPFVLGAMASKKDIDAGLTRQRLERIVGMTSQPAPPAKAPKKAGAR